MGENPAETSVDWSTLWAKFEGFRAGLSRSKAVNVNSTTLRAAARDLVQVYFRHIRPELTSLAIDVSDFDNQMQRLLQLANGRNAKRSYQAVVRELQRIRGSLDGEREQRLGTVLHKTSQQPFSSGVEQKIATTLEHLVPSAALSYRQALVDLQGKDRLSYRGPATELRECLREVLDHLAPDGKVMKSPGFSLEKNQTKPTMKQKARFILKSRGLGTTARSSPEASITRVEDSVGVLARSVYSRGSVSTHIATAREEVLQLKLYVEGVLAELLEIHKAR